jgi:hypothetical protein
VPKGFTWGANGTAPSDGSGGGPAKPAAFGGWDTQGKGGFGTSRGTLFGFGSRKRSGSGDSKPAGFAGFGLGKAPGFIGRGGFGKPGRVGTAINKPFGADVKPKPLGIATSRSDSDAESEDSYSEEEKAEEELVEVEPIRRYHVDCFGLPPRFVQIIRAEIRRYRPRVSLQELDEAVKHLARRLPFLTRRSLFPF